METYLRKKKEWNRHAIHSSSFLLHWNSNTNIPQDVPTAIGGKQRQISLKVNTVLCSSKPEVLDNLQRSGSWPTVED